MSAVCCRLACPICSCTGRRSARLEGFSLHADVAVRARRRDQLERLVRYLVRPPLAAERLTESTGASSCITSAALGPTAPRRSSWPRWKLLERLAALVPAPRRPLLAYHGLLAPHARWRAAVVPPPRADTRMATVPGPRRWSWAQLLRRVFGFDVLVCDRCGGPRRTLGAVTEPHAVRRLLAALGLAAAPPPGPSRAA